METVYFYHLICLLFNPLADRSPSSLYTGEEWSKFDMTLLLGSHFHMFSRFSCSSEADVTENLLQKFFLAIVATIIRLTCYSSCWSTGIINYFWTDWQSNCSKFKLCFENICLYNLFLLDEHIFSSKYHCLCTKAETLKCFFVTVNSNERIKSSSSKSWVSFTK